MARGASSSLDQNKEQDLEYFILLYLNVCTFTLKNLHCLILNNLKLFHLFVSKVEASVWSAYSFPRGHRTLRDHSNLKWSARWETNSMLFSSFVSGGVPEV